MGETPENRRFETSEDGLPKSPWALAEEVTIALQDDAGGSPEFGRPEFRDVGIAEVLQMAKRDRETLVSLFRRYKDPSGSYRIHPAEKLVNALNGV